MFFGIVVVDGILHCCNERRHGVTFFPPKVLGVLLSNIPCLTKHKLTRVVLYYIRYFQPFRIGYG